METKSTELDTEARLADVGRLLLAGLERLEAKKKAQRPALTLVKAAGPAPSRRRPVQHSEQHQEVEP